MAPHSRLGAAIGWLALSLLHGTGPLFADGLSNYGAFGKWTFTASTPEMAKKSLDFAVKYLNLLPIVRNTSKDDYLLIGPTGCDKVKRAWDAERFLVGSDLTELVTEALGRVEDQARSFASGVVVARVHHGDPFRRGEGDKLIGSQDA